METHDSKESLGISVQCVSVDFSEFVEHCVDSTRIHECVGFGYYALIVMQLLTLNAWMEMYWMVKFMMFLTMVDELRCDLPTGTIK